MSEDLRFPVGRFAASPEITSKSKTELIRTIAELPEKMRQAVGDLSDDQLDTRYRPEGWTLRQVVHHVADSHLNSFSRFKLGLTEDAPTIKPYDEKLWAETADSKDAPLEPSLLIIDGVHARWTRLLEAMSDADFERVINHPERGAMSLLQTLALYAWHCRHHTAHITETRRRNEW